MTYDRMESLDVLVRHVQPLVIPCMRSIVLDALQGTAKEFFTLTGIWTDAIDDILPAGAREIEVIPPPDAELLEVRSIYVCDGAPLNENLWRLNYRTVAFETINAANDLCVRLEVTLRPSRHAEKIPSRFVEQWGDALTQGALARLKGMSGVKVEWTDLDGAAIARSLYDRGIAQARAQQFDGIRS